MTQHPDFLTADYQAYAAECRRMAAMTGLSEHQIPRMAHAFRLLAGQTSQIAACIRQPQVRLRLATKRPAYT